MKKSQIGIEFLYFVGVAVVILLIYLVMSSGYFSFAVSRRDTLTAQNLLEQTRNEINLAGRVENGYSRIIKLPNELNGKNYLMKIEGREIYIEFPLGSGTQYARILSTDVSNQPINFEPGISYNLKKNNDQVTITLVS
ncbi:MAG: hypothetical protein QT11_C0001G0941 [archaeon GW2011_AR20]|nr:MAG: hypothetical protein QT11_C0001G0941 [archaeon GW2011_AR20]MBS3160164.1 hypothetical protein [Candidatus Woesearchaeota archaeon]